MTRTLLQLKCLKRDTHELGASELSKDITDDLIDELMDAKIIIKNLTKTGVHSETVAMAKYYEQVWGQS